MPNLYEHIPQQYHADLMAAQDPGSFAGNPAGGILAADPSRRTVLIGLGGLGVKTLEHIKSALRQQFQPGWDSFVGFLAVDTDRYELEQVRHLSPEETLLLVRPDLHAAPYADPNTWPRVWNAIADVENNPIALDMPVNATGCRRLAGRLKLHDCPPGARGGDEEIVRRLIHLVFDRLAPLPHYNNTYDIYVIGSLYGGSSSGMYLDFPALIRRVLRNYNADIRAILYLPADGYASPEMYANTYAALKELAYFQNVRGRDGYPERFPHNDPAIPFLTIDSTEGLFQRVHLVSAASYVSSPRHIQALDLVRGHILCGLESSPGFYVTPPLPHILPPAGATGEDGSPKFCQTISASRMALPPDLLRAYQIGKVCTDAGILPVSDDRRAALIAGGVAILPFRDIGQYPTAQQLRSDTEQLLHPLTAFLSGCMGNSFSYEALFGHRPTWTEIRDGSADTPFILNRTALEIQRLTGPQEEAKLRDEVQTLFQQFRQNVELYVEQNGPMAFVHLLEGRALRDDDSPESPGIAARIMEYRYAFYNRYALLREDARWNLIHIKEEIMNEPNGILVQMLHNTRRQTQAELWLLAFDRHASARINYARLEMLLRHGGIVDLFFLEPAKKLCRQLYAFGCVLEEMTRAYCHHGTVLEDYFHFCSADAGDICVNPCALSRQLHDELLRQADLHVAQQAPMHLRHGIIHDFFQDPDGWLEVEESGITCLDNCFRLNDPHRPIAARRAFDRCVEQMISYISTPTIADWFRMAQRCGISPQDFARMAVSELLRRCNARQDVFHRDIPEYELVFPQELANFVPDVTPMLTGAAQQLMPNVRFRVSSDPACLSLRQVHPPFALSDLPDLERYERCYESCLRQPHNGLHGYSPDTRVTRDPDGCLHYQEQTPWADYPVLLVRPGLNTPGLPRYQRIMQDIGQLVEEARSRGVLYAEQGRDGWIINRIHLSQDVSWQFSPAMLTPDGHTGPTLLRQIIERNGRHPASCTRTVSLDYPGALSRSQPTEADAWALAHRVLWLHRPMLAEIRDTLRLIEPWYRMLNP